MKSFHCVEIIAILVGKQFSCKSSKNEVTEKTNHLYNMCFNQAGDISTLDSGRVDTAV